MTWINIICFGLSYVFVDVLWLLGAKAWRKSRKLGPTPQERFEDAKALAEAGRPLEAMEHLGLFTLSELNDAYLRQAPLRNDANLQ